MAGETKPMLHKAVTGISGLDEITLGGLPAGRSTLLCGNAGCGKTVLAMQFLYNGATFYDEPGVFLTFEETEDDLSRNVASLGYDLAQLCSENKLRVDHLSMGSRRMEVSGEFDLEGVFIRLNQAIESIEATRVVLDGLEMLFSGIADPQILRAEFNRLLQWLKEKGVTAIIAAERGHETLTRHGLEEYIADCVILLDHRVSEQISMRRMRIVKYRGTTHGTDEYPFLIDDNGLSVFPVTSLGLQHEVTTERISTGIEGLDRMLGGEGYYRGSSVLVTGTAGTGKSSLGAHLADAACRRGERVLYCAFEESAPQILRNMRSIGIDLKQWTEQNKLEIHAARPTSTGLEMHLSSMMQQITRFQPRVVIIDPVNSFVTRGNVLEARAMLLRLVDHVKTNRITGFFTSLTGGGEALEQTQAGISSLMDTWLLLTDQDVDAERTRTLTVIKSRGMAHSNQVHEFAITRAGVELGAVFDKSGRRL